MTETGKKTIYGDGTRAVLVTGDEVIVTEVVTSDDGKSSTYHAIAMSHAAFREVVLGWTRHEDEEKGQ